MSTTTTDGNGGNASTTTPDPGDGSGEGTPQAGETKTFDEAYVKRLREENAKHRTEAKANAKAAEELAEIKKAQQTAEERAAEELATARKDAEDARADALRFKVAAKFKVSDEDADLFLTGTDEETLTRQAERLVGLEQERKKNGNRAPNEGANPPSQPSDEHEFVQELFGTPLTT